MMKKSLCLFFVLALIAQICAKPDGKDDAEKAAKDAAAKANKDGKDKVAEASDKPKAEADAHTKKVETAADAAENKAKDDAKRDEKEAKDGQKPDLKRPHGDHLIPNMMVGMEKAGAKLAEAGTNAMANVMKQWGW